MMERLIRILSKVGSVNLHTLACKLLGIGLENSMSKNGEMWFIENELEKYIGEDPCFFDVGANKGNYSILLSSKFPNAVIHAFEPNNHLHKHLKLLTDNIHVNNIGLSSSEEDQLIFFYEKDLSTGHTSRYEKVLKDLHGADGIKSAKAKFSTVDMYMKKNRIEKIDFIKIDTEGHEFEVLLGAKEAIENSRIKVIQFEFNEMNIISRVFLRDFYDLLGKNYKLYRLKPQELYPLKDYSSKYEIFQIQNIVAVSV